MKLVSIRTENTMRCKLAQATFDGHKLVLGGWNGSGKSSFAQSIWMALGGKDAIPLEPVTEGAPFALTELELDEDLIISRKTYPDRTSTLELRNKAGAKFSSPQKMLDALNARFGFWPQEFVMADAKQQAEILRRAVGLDTSELDAKIKETYDERTLVNRGTKELEGQLAGMKLHDVPGELKISDILKKIEEQEAINSSFERAKLMVAQEQKSLSSIEDKIIEYRDRIRDLEAQADNSRKLIKIHQDKVQTIHPKNTDGLRAQLAEAESNNIKHRENLKRAEVSRELVSRKAASERMTREIEKYEREKCELIENAAFPVPGLGFDENGVTYQGKPFSQASSAQQYEVAIGVAFKLNPKLKIVYLQHGSLLDPAAMARVDALVKKEGGQLLVEVVGDSEDVTVLFEDGWGHNKHGQKQEAA